MLLAVSTLFATRPSATDSQISATASQPEDPERNQPAQRAGSSMIADQQRHGNRHGEADQRQGQAAEDMTGKHSGSPDTHRLEAGDDALGHVLGHGDGGDLSGAGDGEQQHSGSEEVDVGVATATDRDSVAERAAEDVHEQQQEHDRHQDREQGQPGIALQMAQVAPQHGGGIA